MSKLPFNPIIWPAVPHDHTGDNQLGYYNVETTQRYVWGTRGITWDGKVYRYGRAKGTATYGYGVVNYATVDVSNLINTSHPNTITAGDRTFVMGITSTEGYGAGATGIAEDELVGATYMCGSNSSRTIVGNTAIAATTTGTIICEVDYPFVTTVTTGWNDCPLNPYGYLVKNLNYIASVMGVPNVSATTGQNLWIQTWGPCWCNPGGADATIGDGTLNREAYFVGDGSVVGGDIATIENGEQHAGFIIDSTEAATGCVPIIMLQISV